MALKNTKKNEEKKIKIAHPESVKVTRAQQLDSGVVMFDVIVDGVVNITGMSARDYTNQQGESGTLINYPSYKGSNGKWYTYCFFPITAELKDLIINQINDMI